MRCNLRYSYKHYPSDTLQNVITELSDGICRINKADSIGDIRISFVHSAMQRYENLNLDIADIFKPIIIDRVICTLLNKRMIAKNKHFQREELGATFLNNDGKQIMIQELERKMNQVITVASIKYTYERLIYQEIKNLENSFLKGQKYKPFKYQV